jgi:T5SS/PEP-CTERM-associated repeat protein
MMRKNAFAGRAFCAVLASVFLVSVVNADIGYFGQVSPTNPSSWTLSTSAKISTGTVSVDGGDDIVSNLGYIGELLSSTGQVTIDGAGSTWTNNSFFHVGYNGNATLGISNGGAMICNSTSDIGNNSPSTGLVTVDGSGTTFTNDAYLYIGRSGGGTLQVSNGGTVSNVYDGFIGGSAGSTGLVTVNGVGSKWTTGRDLYVGCFGTGTLEITNGGLVSVAGTFTIDADTDSDGFVKMSTGGMLAIPGDVHGSITEFLGSAVGSDAIKWWNESASSWSLIATTGTINTDYSLDYITTGDLTGYTVLTVGTVPEPSTVAMLIIGLLSLGSMKLIRRKS